MATALQGFLLTRHWRERRGQLEFEFWIGADDGPVRVLMTDQEAVFFTERDDPGSTTGRRVPIELKSLAGAPLDAVYCPTRAALEREAAAIQRSGGRVCESDVKPLDRFLMERFIRGGVSVEGDPDRSKDGPLTFVNPILRAAAYTPAFRVLSIDIETEGLTGALYSIAAVSATNESVFMVADQPVDGGVRVYPSEKALLEAFFAWLQEADPDVITGWNVIDFDLSFLEQRCKKLGVSFRLGRNRAPAVFLPPATTRQTRTVRAPGRVVLDGIAMLRAASWTFERYSLEHVARDLLGRGKLIETPGQRVAEIQRLYREDKPALARYNLEDCRLVLDILDAADLINFTVERTRLTGLPLDRQGGSVAAFDFRYLPLLHRKGHAAPNVGTIADPITSPGGYVMDSEPGLYGNVLLLDFKSLYPSIIRTFKVDPLGMAVAGEDAVPGFDGARFSREHTILPELIAELGASREEAKRKGNKPLSQAIKIMMNSFYGVLGTPGCRFYHPRLASSVTRRGHDIITRSRTFIEERGLKVIYGDTDSVFVHAGNDRAETECREMGAALARELNAWWAETLREELALESFLEIEFETHYLRFFMPTIRGSDKGSKKRYAGLMRNAAGDLEAVFTGLEAVRTDWTPLARNFQRELFRRLFLGEPVEDFIRGIAAEVLAGKHDERLVYRKRLRRPIGDYVKNVPPHVKAARKLNAPGRWIAYAITVNGPEPWEARESPLDYAHYLERQLAPAADGILRHFNMSFAELTQAQLEMFERSAWTTTTQIPVSPP